MKEYIKILDDLRPEETRFPFDPLNKNLCFGGGSPAPLPKPKIVLPKIEIGGTLGEGLDAGKAGLESAADAGKTNLATGADAGKAFAHEAADQFKAGMQKLGLHKKDDPGSDDAPGAAASVGEAKTVGEGSSKIQMKEAVASKGKKAKMGAKGKRALRKVGATV